LIAILPDTALGHKITSVHDELATNIGEPDDGDALALTFAQTATPAEVEEKDDEEKLGRYR
jgi:hypothetical protein